MRVIRPHPASPAVAATRRGHPETVAGRRPGDRARLGAKLAESLPGDMDKVLFTLGGAEAVENAIKLARHFTGRPTGR